MAEALTGTSIGRNNPTRDRRRASLRAALLLAAAAQILAVSQDARAESQREHRMIETYSIRHLFDLRDQDARSGGLAQALATGEAPFLAESDFARPRHAAADEASAMLTLIEADFVESQGSTADGFRGVEIELSALMARRPELRRELECMSLNIYHEARNEPARGMAAVAHVVMNRMADARFPSTACDVIRQGGERVKHRCQFSWWCDGLSDRPRNRKRWRKIMEIAQDAYWSRSEDPTGGALWYHADYVSPYWGRIFERGPTIGRHIFYREPQPRTQLAIRTARANGANLAPTSLTD